MLFYDADNPAPNPRRVRIFMAEKGIEVPTKSVSIIEREQKAPDYVKKNSLGQIPILELDDGTILAESISICRYLEALNPEPALFGGTPLEMAQIDMWNRRIEMQVHAPIGLFWRHAHPFTAKIIKQYTDFGQSNLENSHNAMRWLDKEIANRDFIAGDTYSIADISALCAIDFANFIGIDIPEDCKALHAWHKRVSERPSAQA